MKWFTQKILMLFIGLIVVVIFAQGKQSNAAYYSGKTVTILVGFPAGGGADLIARVLAKHIGTNIAGNPKVIVKNMPGGGGIRATNFLKDKGKPDGLTIIWGPWQPFAQVVGQRGMRFKYDKMTFVGGARAAPSVMYVRKDALPKGAENVSGLLQSNKPIRYAAIRPTVFLSMFGRTALDLLGVKYKYVPGYKGGAKVWVAVQSGEGDLAVTSTANYRSSIVPNLVKKGIAVPLLAAPALDDAGNFVRSESLPELPHFLEVYKKVHNGKMPSGLQWEFMKLLVYSFNNLTLAAFGPPNMDKTATEALAKGFYATLSSELFIKELFKRAGVRQVPRTKKHAMSVFNQINNVKPEMVTFIKKFLGKGRKKRKKKVAKD